MDYYLFLPADMVLVEVVTVLLSLLNIAVKLIWHLLPGPRDDMLKWMASLLTTLKFVFTEFCSESHKR